MDLVRNFFFKIYIYFLYFLLFFHTVSSAQQIKYYVFSVSHTMIVSLFCLFAFTVNDRAVSTKINAS